MYMKDLPGTTLIDLANEYDQDLKTWGGPASEIVAQLDRDEPHFSLGTERIEVPATKDGLASFATFFDIPPKFFARMDRDLQQPVLSRFMRQFEGDVTVQYQDGGIYEIRSAGETRVRPHRLIEAALATFPEQSPIVEHRNNQNELRVDVIFPEDFDRFVGGDRGVGDITHGGMRIAQDRKKNVAPTLQTFMWRKVCTNGLEVPDAGLKVAAAGATAEEIEAMFEAEIARAVDRLEADIQAFYDLRNQPLGNDPTGALHRAATEMNLPMRTIGRMEDLVPALVDNSVEGGSFTMFDIVNLMTNQANDPQMQNNSSGRRNLQLAGGRLVRDHAERCGTCHSRLGR